MKVLVTGSAGFIGSRVSERLLQRGDEVVGLDILTTYYDVQLKKARLAKIKDHPGFTEARKVIASMSRDDEKEGAYFWIALLQLESGDIVDAQNTLSLADEDGARDSIARYMALIQAEAGYYDEAQATAAGLWFKFDDIQQELKEANSLYNSKTTREQEVDYWSNIDWENPYRYRKGYRIPPGTSDLTEMYVSQEAVKDVSAYLDEFKEEAAAGPKDNTVRLGSGSHGLAVTVPHRLQLLLPAR